MSQMPKLYDELADWWQLISPTSDYEDEGEFFGKLFKDAGAKTILELGAGGGNVAWYLKKDFDMTLTDLAPGMVAMSKQQNPECENLAGDMKSLRLNRTFDGVLIHDAIMYMLSEDDLSKAFETAAVHLNPGGTVVIAPDCLRETFRETTEYEGHDQGDRAVRYMQWITDPDPTDTVFDYDFVIALKEHGEIRTIVDRQVCGVFPRQTWLDLLVKAGFTAKSITGVTMNDKSDERTEVFVGVKK